MKTSNPQRVYYPALDGLRGIAILLVILYHNFDFVPYFEFGWLGVDLFFVLSGFLITDILIQTRESKNYLRNFYVKRILRIFPLYYLCLFVFLILVPTLSNFNVQVSYYQTNQGWLWMYLQNWLYIADTTNRTNILHHLWSLAVEEQFYMIWPVVVLLTGNYKKLLVIILSFLLVVIAFRYSIYILKPEKVSFFAFYTFSRIDGICIGCALSLLHTFNPGWLIKNSKKIISALVIANAFYFLIRFLLHSNIPYIPFLGYPTIAAFFALMVFYATIQKKPTRHLSTGIFKFFGKLSYSLYIFHWPVYIILFPYLHSLLSHLIPTAAIAAQVFSAILCVLLAIGMSLLSHNTIERYFMQLKNKLAY